MFGFGFGGGPARRERRMERRMERNIRRVSHQTNAHSHTHTLGKRALVNVSDEANCLHRLRTVKNVLQCVI